MGPPSVEVGILDEVLTNDLFGDTILILINYQGFRYFGWLHLDDAAFAAELVTILQSNIGRSIKEIGDIELFDTI